MKGSKVVTKKSPPFVPRLDLSGTGAGVKVEAREETSLAFRQKPPQPPCDQFENPSRRTSRRTDSARLISLTDADDRFGGSNDSARTMLSRIKRRAKGASCGGEAGGPISVTSSGNDDNHVVKKPGLEEVVVVADDLHREPSILEVVEPTTAVMMQSVPESGFTEIACKDGAHGTPVHELRRSGGENVGGGPANLQASRQERRIQILLWPTREKLSTLQTLNNTMFLWEDKPANTCAFSDDSVDLVLDSLIAAKESQRRLFDTLDGVPGVPRRAICCSAVRELVRAYPAERLVPTSFINDHFVAKFLQRTVCQYCRSCQYCPSGGD